MTASPPPLTPAQFERYRRHLSLPELGVEGQRKLLDGRVLLIGAGGLGCPLAQYLAAAGVGTLGLIDFDRVDVSNLQRQVLYATSDVGRPKVEVAAERIRAQNPDVRVVTHAVQLTSENALALLGRLGRDRGRKRQLPDALPRERRLRAARQAERARLDLPLRRPGERLRFALGPLLSLPVSRAAAARARCPPARREACSGCCRAWSR